MTLSDDDKKRITDEEKERLKVRDQLEQEKNKKRKMPKWALFGCGGLIALIVIIVVISVALGSKSTTTNSLTQTSLPPQISTPTYSGPEVKYEVTGTASSVNITIENAQGGTEQYNDVGMGSNYSYASFPGNFLYISAQNQGVSGTVTVNIYYEGQLIKTSTSSGGYAIATASDSK